jgi:hypothetical protein
MALLGLAQKQETLSLYTIPTSPLVFVTMNYNQGRHVSALSYDPCLHRFKLISPYTKPHTHTHTHIYIYIGVCVCVCGPR